MESVEKKFIRNKRQKNLKENSRLEIIALLKNMKYQTKYPKMNSKRKNFKQKQRQQELENIELISNENVRTLEEDIFDKMDIDFSNGIRNILNLCQRMTQNQLIFSNYQYLTKFLDNLQSNDFVCKSTNT